MTAKQELMQWVASIFWSRMGDLYIRVYSDAPDWIPKLATSHFGECITVERSGHRRAEPVL